jgi:glyoxylase-like metal-dependent hydrolase (beta-lactamase superfamily II)
VNQVYPLHTGFLGWRELPSLAMIMHPVYAYLIVTPAGKTILIDTGNPRSLIGKTRAAPWFDAPLAMNNEDNLIARLSQTGHAIANIDLLVATHFDFNHCGNNDLFDGSRIECWRSKHCSTTPGSATATTGRSGTGQAFATGLWTGRRNSRRESRWSKRAGTPPATSPC